MPDPVAVEQSTIFASTAGGLVSALANRSTDSWKRKVSEGVIGAFVGVFAGPAFADALNIVNEHTRIAVAFGTGAGGAIVLTTFLDWLKSTSFRDMVSRYLGKTS